jgi:hypothetical protein
MDTLSWEIQFYDLSLNTSANCYRYDLDEPGWTWPNHRAGMLLYGVVSGGSKLKEKILDKEFSGPSKQKLIEFHRRMKELVHGIRPHARSIYDIGIGR